MLAYIIYLRYIAPFDISRRIYSCLVIYTITLLNEVSPVYLQNCHIYIA